MIDYYFNIYFNWLNNGPTSVFTKGPFVNQMGQWGPQVSQKWAFSDLYVLKDTRAPPRWNTAKCMVYRLLKQIQHKLNLIDSMST